MENATDTLFLQTPQLEWTINWPRNLFDDHKIMETSPLSSTKIVKFRDGRWRKKKSRFVRRGRFL